MKSRVAATKVSGGEDPNVIRLASIIRNYGIKHNLSEAVRYFEEAKKSHPERIGVYTYTAMVGACVRCQDLPLAIKYFDEMRENNIEPNVITYNTLIAGYNRRKDYDKAWELFQEIKSKGLTPDETTFSYILAHQTETNNEERRKMVEAEIAAVQGQDPGQNLKNDLIRASIVGNVPETFKCYERIKEAGIPLDWFIAKHVLKACATAGDYHRVPAVYEEFSKDPKVRLQTYESNIIIQGYVVNGNMDMAEKIFHEMSEIGNYRNNHTYNALIGGWAKLGRPDKILECINLMAKDEIKFDDVSFTILVQGLVKARHFDLIEPIYEAFSKLRTEPSGLLFSTIINGFIQATDYERAEKYYQIALSFPTAKSSHEPYNIMLKLCIRTKDYPKARRVYESMIANGTTPDISTYNSLIAASHNSAECVRECLREIERRGLRINEPTASTIITVLGRANASEDAEPFIQRYWNTRHNILINTILAFYSLTRNHEKCYAFFETLPMRGVIIDAYVLSRVGPALVHLGKLDTLWKILDDFAGKGNELDHLHFHYVAAPMMKTGKWDAILRLVEDYMPKFGIHPVETVAVAYSKAKRHRQELQRQKASSGTQVNS